MNFSTSVIIPTCDRPAEYLLRAIGSVMKQSYAPAEVLVIDNGSAGVVENSMPEGVILCRLPPRIGPSRARNFGAAMAKGTHLSFLDDDDWWEPDFLQEAWRVLLAEETRCVYGRLDQLKGERRQFFKCASSDTLTISHLLQRNPGTGGSNLIIEKMLFWSIGGFDQRMRSSEDKSLALEVLRMGENVSVAPLAIAVCQAHSGERLSEARLQKLKFVWIYRELYGSLSAMRKMFQIIWAHIRHGL